jgi:hypothetical protein
MTALHQRLHPNWPAPQALFLAGTRGLELTGPPYWKLRFPTKKSRGPDLSHLDDLQPKETQDEETNDPHVYRKSTSDHSRPDSTGS